MPGACLTPVIRQRSRRDDIDLSGSRRLRHGYSQHLSDLFGQFTGILGIVGITNAPIPGGISQGSGGDEIKTIALPNRDFLQERQLLSTGQKASSNIGQGLAIRAGYGGRLKGGVSAGEIEHKTPSSTAIAQEPNLHS